MSADIFWKKIIRWFKDEDRKLTLDLMNIIMSLFLGFIGLGLGGWSIFLTFQLDAYHKEAQRLALRSAFNQIETLLPWHGRGELESYSDDEMQLFLSEVYGVVASQLSNEYILSKKECAETWKHFNDMLWINIKSEGYSDSLIGSGTKKDFSGNFYRGWHHIMIDCMGYN